MPKFIRQNNDYSCGPVALYNLGTFYQIKFDYDFLYHLCKCNPKSGTKTRNFTLALNSLAKQGFFQIVENVKDPKHFLKSKGNCVLMEYKQQDEWHFVLVVSNYVINKNGKNKQKPIIQLRDENFDENFLNQDAKFWFVSNLLN